MNTIEVLAALPTLPKHIYDSHNDTDKMTIEDLKDSTFLANIEDTDSTLIRMALPYSDGDKIRELKYLNGSGAYKVTQ